MDEIELERYPRFTWAEIKKHLEEKKPFEAISPMASAFIRVREYRPLIGLAIHAGHRVREELLMKMSIEEDERRHEEDDYVEEFVADFPIQMIGLDSRYEYDINRPRQQAVYLKPFQSWGKKVWLHPPTPEELEISYQKHDEFHELVDFLAEQTSAMFGQALVIDMHSYNANRPAYANRNAPLPLFNLAISKEDRDKSGKIIDYMMERLRKLSLSGAEPVVKENDVFIKDGALATALSARHPNTLVVPLEIKKIYLEESNGNPKRDVVSQLRKELGKLANEIVDKFMAIKK